jgi:hypothetical protein
MLAVSGLHSGWEEGTSGSELVIDWEQMESFVINEALNGKVVHKTNLNQI